MVWQENAPRCMHRGACVFEMCSARIGWLWAAGREECEEGADIEEVPAAVIVEVGLDILVCEVGEERTDIEEVEDAVVVVIDRTFDWVVAIRRGDTDFDRAAL